MWLFFFFLFFFFFSVCENLAPNLFFKKKKKKKKKPFYLYWSMGFPGGSDGKESAYNGRRPMFDPCVEKIPWRREWQPTLVFFFFNMYLFGCA